MKDSTDKVREARLRCFGHIQRRDTEYIGTKVVESGAAGQKERKRKTTETVHGCCEGRHKDSLCNRRGHKGEDKTEADVSL